MNYSKEDLYQIVDKFVIILVGAPRGITTKTWRKNLPKIMQTTKEEYSDVPITAICVTNEYDDPDRYLEGEDLTLAGLGPNFYPGRWSTDPNLHETPQWEVLSKNMMEIGPKRSWGKRKLHKQRWEEYQLEQWGWCDDIRFSYFDQYQEIADWDDYYRQQNLQQYQSNVKTPEWANQLLHVCQAYKDHRDVFDSLTEHSVVLRIRWDFHTGWNMWNHAGMLFIPQSSKGHLIHDQGWRITPKVLAKNMTIFGGFPTSNDYWHCMDGNGACIVGQKFRYWMLKDMRTRAPHIYFTDWDKPINNKNPFKIPESAFMQFFQYYNFTIYDLRMDDKHGQSQAFNDNLSSFKVLMSDRWRMYWYDWTDEMIKEIQNAT